MLKPYIQVNKGWYCVSALVPPTAKSGLFTALRMCYAASSGRAGHGRRGCSHHLPGLLLIRQPVHHDSCPRANFGGDRIQGLPADVPQQVHAHASGSGPQLCRVWSCPPVSERSAAACRAGHLARVFVRQVQKPGHSHAHTWRVERHSIDGAVPAGSLGCGCEAAHSQQLILHERSMSAGA